jgi:autotransporter-associated beta strand protein
MRSLIPRTSFRAAVSLLLLQAATLAVAVVAVPRVALAVDGTWTATTSGSWQITSNWAGGIVGTGSAGIATFAPDITSDVTVTNNQSRAIGSMVFGTDSAPTGTGIWIVSGSLFTFTNGTANNATITVNSSRTANIACLIQSGTPLNAMLVKNGAGTLILSSTGNNISTNVAITNGTLEISKDNQLGAAPGSFFPSRLQISNGATLRTNGVSTLTQNRGITIGSGGGTLSVTGSNMVYGGRLTGAGNTATVTGSNALTLTNVSGSATNVNWDFASNSGVRTFFQGSNALGTGSVTVRNGVRLTSQSTAPTSGQVPNAVTVESGGGLTNRSTTGTVVTYTNVTLPSSGSILLNNDDQSTTGLTISSGGTLTGDLTLDTTQGGTNAVGRVTLSGVFGGSGGLIKSGSGTSGVLVLEGSNTYTGTTSVTTGELYVNGDQSLATGPVVVSANATLGGSGTVGGLVSLASTATVKPGFGVGTLTLSGPLSLGSGVNYNWQMMSGTGVAGATDAWDLLAVSGTLSIDSTSADPFKINLATVSGTAAASGSATNFDPLANYSWTIATAAGGITGFASDKFLITSSATNGTGGFINDLAGGTFSLAQSGNDLNLVFTAGAPTVITINVASGTQTQAEAGYALLSGSIPVLKTGSGTLVVNAANTLTGSTTVAGGRLQLADGGALGSSRIVPISGGTVTLSPALQTTVGGLDPNAGGLVDVGNGLMTVAAGLSEADMLTALLTGRGDGSWNGTAGITSSQAQADIAVSVPRTVGWLNNGDGSMTFAFAAAGDTNLDWTVDILDAANFLAGGKFDSGLPASWLEGDFGYDGVVDILDAADFLSTGLFDAGPYNPTASGSIAAVPEPSAWAMATALGCVVALHRLRCRRTKEQASP